MSVAHYPDDRAAMQGLERDEVDMVATLSDDFTHTVGTHLQFTRPVLVGWRWLSGARKKHRDKARGN